MRAPRGARQILIDPAEDVRLPNLSYYITSCVSAPNFAAHAAKLIIPIGTTMTNPCANFFVRILTDSAR
jgi:hypothetical protein